MGMRSHAARAWRAGTILQRGVRRRILTAYRADALLRPRARGAYCSCMSIRARGAPTRTRRSAERRPGGLRVASLLLLLALPPARPRLGAQEAPRAIRVPTLAGGDVAARTVAGAVARVQDGQAAARMAELRDALARTPDDAVARLELASLARLTFAYATADSLYDRASRDTVGESAAVAAYARLGRAQGLAARGRMRELEAAYGDAAGLAASAAPGALVESYLGRAALRGRTLGRVAARATLDSASGALRGIGDAIAPDERRRLHALVACGRAAIGVRTADPATAALLDSGIALAGEDFPRVRGACLFVRAQTHAGAGAMNRAVLALDSAEAELRRAGDRTTLAAVLQWRGFVWLTLGNHQGGRLALGAALAEGTASEAIQPMAWALLNVADSYRSMGEPHLASEYLTRAAAMFDRIGDGYGIAMTQAQFGALALDAGDLAGARVAQLASRRWSEAAGDWQMTADAQRAMAWIAARAGDWPLAQAMLDSSAAIMLQRGGARWAPSMAWDRARLALQHGEPARAERELRAALPHYVPSQGNQRYRLLANLAEARLRQGDTADAARLLREGSDALDTWRGSLDDARLRAVAFEPRGPIEDLPSAELVIAGVARSGRVDEAFALAERRRARALVDAMLRAGGVAGSAPGAPGMRGAAPFSLADAQAALPDDRTALLHFMLGRDHAPSTLFVVTRRDARAYPLPVEDSLRVLVERLAFRAERGVDARAVARTLGAQLLGAAVGAMPARVRRLVVVPDGALHLVPFELLEPTPGSMLGTRYAVSLVPSATALALVRARPAQGTRPVRVLALADPQLPTEEEDAAEARPPALPRLPAAASEARTAAALGAGSLVLTGSEASEAALRRLSADGFAVVHVATHAVVDDLRPWASLLTLAAGGGEDGFVRAGELAALPLRADLVVLSACRSAGGLALRGEGVQGFASPLLAAGARAVVVSRWAVRDRDAARFMRAFYAALGRGVAAGDALAAAAAELRAAGAAPRVWAAFTLVGDPDVRFATGR